MKILVVSRREFEAYIAKLNRKAARLCVDPIEATYVQDVDTTRTVAEIIEGESFERTYPITVHEYELSGLDVGEDGWRIVATITPVPETNRHFVDVIPGEVVDTVKYESRPTQCDHCNSRRQRYLTHVVRHQDGRELQVGKTCLKDLVGGHSAAALEFQSFIVAAIGCGEGDLWEGSGFKKADLVSVKECVQSAEVLRILYGRWINNEKDDFGVLRVEGTHRLARALVTDRKGFFRATSVLEKDVDTHWEFAGQVADDVLINFEDLVVDEDNDFEVALAYALRFEYVPVQKAALVAYAGEYLRNLAERLEWEAKKASMKHVGQVGKRQEFTLVCVRVRSFDSTYGTTYINVFEDSDGNELTWKSGTYCFEEGESVRLKATVKEHGEFNSAPVTYITRGKILETV